MENVSNKNHIDLKGNDAYDECRILANGNIWNITLKRQVHPCDCAAEAIECLNSCTIASRLYSLQNGMLELKTSLFCKEKPTVGDIANIIAGLVADLKATTLLVEKGDDNDE